ncbi:unnamed protein product [Adineta steineri]|uniref:YEATS domain-containing protein n=1 Tax=Adineta steineri TaxID=433720 RepID=A0A815TLV8_9BILA|nr:unnamed protein product [Adineta steineri]CAF1504768.1 unnamed protein product [Adineta steineri]CAF3729083.1 unnamed protein product [Adineta steineri]CAF3914965.1 unnamed protein product [Adineta steineri]
MTDFDDDSEIIEIDLLVGHTSTIRAEPTTTHNPPRTHDWEVYVRSADAHGDLSCLVQRCVFYLHPEYPNNKREVNVTQFVIQESGYAGFHLPIEIFFRTKKDPKKFRIEYDLDLHTNVEGHPYHQKETYVRKFRCTFYDPDPDFRQKVLAAGGKMKDIDTVSTNNNDSNVEEESTSPPAPASPPSESDRDPARPGRDLKTLF